MPWLYAGYPVSLPLVPPHSCIALQRRRIHQRRWATTFRIQVLILGSLPGVTYRWLKLEGSVFNGREPDEHRYNFEAHPWNSISMRLNGADE
jgi:hypothetical protein